MVGLEDQLLGKLILKEKYELEQQRMALVEEVTSYKKKIKQLEDDLLFRLANSTGNILDDQGAIDVLGEAKRVSDEISRKQAIAEETGVRLDKTRMGYIPAAFRASLLFFCITDMASIDPMYQFSLSWYIGLFERAIDDAPQSDDLAKVRIALTKSLRLFDHTILTLFWQNSKAHKKHHRVDDVFHLPVHPARFVRAAQTDVCADVNKQNPSQRQGVEFGFSKRVSERRREPRPKVG